MSLYRGIDLHSNNQVIVVIDDQDKRMLERRVPNELGATLSVLEPFREDLLGVAVESTYGRTGRTRTPICWEEILPEFGKFSYSLSMARPLACFPNPNSAKPPCPCLGASSSRWRQHPTIIVSRAAFGASTCADSMPRPGETFRTGETGSESRIFELSEVFAIDVCAYAVMSNHCHLVLSVDQSGRWVGMIARWPALDEIVRRHALVRSFAAGEKLSEAQLAAVDLKIDEYRKRLFDISWFMRCLNEPIARMANAETKLPGASGRGDSRARRCSTRPR